MSLNQLESLWARPTALPPPRGRYRGHVLRRIDHETSRRARWLWTERIAFEWIPFGIDFDRRLWFFITGHLAMARFEARPGPSRWRDAEAIGLSYGPSKLPHVVRSVLYDEVKPLSGRLVLGIGGISRARGEGEHFFFALDKE